jgi:hypothetical protein
MRLGLRSILAASLAAALLMLGPGTRAAQAAAVLTEQLPAASAPLPRPDRRALARELERLGVDPAEAQRRVDALSAAEVAELQRRIDALPAGGFVGAIVGAALIVFLVLLITDIAGLTDVFTFVRKPAERR